MRWLPIRLPNPGSCEIPALVQFQGDGPMRVSLSIRERGSRQYRSANPRTLYPAGTIYVLQHSLDQKRNMGDPAQDKL